MFIKKIAKRIVRGYKCDAEHYIKFLREGGAKIGEGVVLFSPESFSCDVHNRHLLHIGNNVQITENVTILMHDYSWSVIKGVTGEIIGNQNSVWIGDNVFVGMRTIILDGSRIGNNVIIGAGSVVKGHLEDDSVYAGVPAKRIMSLTEFREKRMMAQKNEAFNIAINYYEAFGEWPNENLFHEYFFLFCNNTTSNKIFDEKMKLVGNYEKTKKVLETHTPQYESYNKFIDDVKRQYMRGQTDREIN